jgi:hypothetical protein
VCRPNWLSDNTFIQAFVGPDLLSLLVVIVTITFASVANIHLSLNRFTAHASPKIRQGVSEIRAEINSNAWLIFAAFVASVMSLIVKGELTGYPTGLAAADGVCLLALLLNVLVMHDLYHAIFALASANLSRASEAEPVDEIDFSEDSPRAV